MQHYILLLINNSIVMSILIVFLLIFNGLFGKKYPTKWRYYIWFIIVIGLVIPFRPNLNLSITKFITPINLNVKNLGATINQAPNFKIFTFNSIIFIVWFIGVLLLSIYHIQRYKKFMITVKRWSSPVTNTEVLNSFENAKKSLDVKNSNISLNICKFPTSPMLVGFLKPIILLPEHEILIEDLDLIFFHEIIHYKRKDLWTKTLVLFCVILNWFNPLVYIMANMIYIDCESSCDEAVVFGKNFEKRKQYGETILNTIGLKNTLNPILSIQFYSGKKFMKKRLFSILDMKKKKYTVGIFSALIIGITTLLSNNVFAKADNNILNLNTTKSTYKKSIISIEKATEIALGAIKGCKIIEYELEEDEDIVVYEFKVLNNLKKYEIDINAINGSVLDIEED